MCDHPDISNGEVRGGGAGLFPVAEGSDGDVKAGGEVCLRETERGAGAADQAGALAAIKTFCADVEVFGVGYKPIYDPENLKPRS